MKKLRMVTVGLLSVSLLGLPPPLAAYAEAPTVTPQVEDQPDWIGGLSPDFDIEGHRGEEIRVGISWEDGVPVGRVATSETSDKPQVGVMNIPFSPVDSYECDPMNNADHVIASMPTFPYTNNGENLWSGGDVAAGSAGSGPRRH